MRQVVESSEMSCEYEAAILLKRIAEPRQVGDSVKAAILRSAQRLGWKPSRTREIWYLRAHRIDAQEMDALRELAAKGAARYEAIARAMESTIRSSIARTLLRWSMWLSRLRGEDLPGDD